MTTAALTRFNDPAQERDFLRACIANLEPILRDARQRLSHLSSQEEPQAPLEPTDVARLQLLEARQASGGLIVPAGMVGRVLARYEDDGETGFLVQFGGGLIARVPDYSGLAEPLKEAHP